MFVNVLAIWAIIYILVRIFIRPIANWPSAILVFATELMCVFAGVELFRCL